MSLFFMKIIRYIEVKCFTSNLLIVNQLQNGFSIWGPRALLYFYENIFTFLDFFL